MTKLSTRLFLIDVEAYKTHGRSITGHAYKKLPHGLAPRYMLALREELELNGELALVRRDDADLVQYHPVALLDADTSVFSDEQLALINAVLEQRRTIDGSELHDVVGWALAELGETIPYAVALIDKDQGEASEQERKGAVVRGGGKLVSGYT